jgi:hypothetical protein
MKLVIDKNSNFTHKGGANAKTPLPSEHATREGQKAHTPLPWKISVNGMGQLFITSDDSEHDISRVEDLSNQWANAEFIVSACNSHEALRDICEKAKRLIEHEGTSFTPDIRATAIGVLTDLNTALDKAPESYSALRASHDELLAALETAKFELTCMKYSDRSDTMI